MARQRDFDQGVLDHYVDLRLKVRWNSTGLFENRVWQFVVLVPRWLLTSGGREPICTAHDLRLIEDLLWRDFGGYTSMVSPVRGLGLRDQQVEKNLHTQITVLAARWRGTRRYFRALRRELEKCSGEKTIAIFRQELVIV